VNCFSSGAIVRIGGSQLCIGGAPSAKYSSTERKRVGDGNGRFVEYEINTLNEQNIANLVLLRFQLSESESEMEMVGSLNMKSEILMSNILRI